MQKTVITCDICKKSAKPYKYFVNKCMDASGCGYCYDYKYVDFCAAHYNRFIEENPDKPLIKP